MCLGYGYTVGQYNDSSNGDVDTLYTHVLKYYT